MGNFEKLEIGCKQFFRSSVHVDFDNATDDLRTELYVVWYGNLTSHILPHCIVSYKYNRHLICQVNVAPFRYSITFECHERKEIVFKMQILV